MAHLWRLWGQCYKRNLVDGARVTSILIKLFLTIKVEITHCQRMFFMSWPPGPIVWKNINADNINLTENVNYGWCRLLTFWLEPLDIVQRQVRSEPAIESVFDFWHFCHWHSHCWTPVVSRSRFGPLEQQYEGEFVLCYTCGSFQWPIFISKLTTVKKSKIQSCGLKLKSVNGSH